ncbi:hypothetical protein D9756_007799 [Leucocoprinus leucothites]|uniref:laccase n=1 Tax=Leucocoprinus leucothites TaxID=201217 RepID=A0A8H5D4T4_9AGAR|nr:hypothetical protein D9756_007799 [Leucoagaricus leucothites]
MGLVSYLAGILSLVAATSAALGPVSTLSIANANISPDGFKRAASLVNHEHPGPVITAMKGDHFRIKVVNKLTDPTQSRGTSINWHGFTQHNNNFMDGASGITQCPIAPGNSFEYTFQADRAGSFWYHSHEQLQYCDGVRGAIIVRDPNDPLKTFYDVDDDAHIITLSELYHEVASSIKGISMADSTLINGKGRFPGGPNAELAVINVDHGKRYRLRLVSISCDPNFMFSIDCHDLMVVEADSVATQPFIVQSLQIFAGQRYSVVLNANQKVDNYWIRALPNTGARNLSTTFENGVNSAILRYRGAPRRDPKSKQDDNIVTLREVDLHPLVNPAAPGDPTPDGADVTFNLTLGLDLVALKFTINNQSFVPPTTPVLMQILSGARTAQDLMPQGGVLTVERNKTVQIVLNSGVTGGPHPISLHGHTFSVVKSADHECFNFANPVQRDVVSAGDTVGDFVVIRFRTDNPGPWILRCHINFHYGMGLAVVFAEAPDDVASANRNIPTEWDQLCPAWDALPDTVKVPQVDNSTTPT